MFDFKEAEKIFKQKKKSILSDERINEIKDFFPELKKWKNSSVDNLWRQYALSIFMSKDDIIWIKERKEDILAYIWIKYSFPDFKFGEEGMFEDYLKKFSLQKPWLYDIKDIIKPKWLSYSFLTE